MRMRSVRVTTPVISPRSWTGIWPQPVWIISVRTRSAESSGVTVTAPSCMMRLTGCLAQRCWSARSTALRVTRPSTSCSPRATTGKPSWPVRSICWATSAMSSSGWATRTPCDIRSATLTRGWMYWGRRSFSSAQTSWAPRWRTSAAAARSCPPPPKVSATSATLMSSVALRATNWVFPLASTKMKSAEGSSRSRSLWASVEISSSVWGGETAHATTMGWPSMSKVSACS